MVEYKCPVCRSKVGKVHEWPGVIAVLTAFCKSCGWVEHVLVER